MPDIILGKLRPVTQDDVNWLMHVVSQHHDLKQELERLLTDTRTFFSALAMLKTNLEHALSGDMTIRNHPVPGIEVGTVAEASGQ